ncbi:MAG TPA: aldehyde dehydrogenase family protein [Candidatus Sulfotelmatobacter sp.]|nr:aldehyde dehydrogenase family protein [Candidatus Sulfotelmatobacter sp.]
MTALAGDVLRSFDPSTGAELGGVPLASAADVQRAVARAHAAFERGLWSRDAKLRARVLLAWADALEAQAGELVPLIVRETGKIVREARAEVAGSVDALRYNAGLARYVGGRAGTLPDGSVAHLERTPLGVTGFITPWNWPLLLVLRDLAPALAAGVTAVLKPAEQTPLVVQRMLDIGYGAGVPEDVVQVVHGVGPSVGAALVRHPDVRAVAFTGSSATGAIIARDAAATFKTVLLELGGKASNVLFADAELDRAVSAVVRNAFVTAGQMCMACTRVLVERSVYADVLAAIVARVRALRVGDPFDEATDLGALITEQHLARVLGFVEDPQRTGTIEAGGKRARPAGLSGTFMEATVVAGPARGATIVREEVFGPVVTVEPFEGDDDAIALANATDYGLSAGVWTADVRRAWRMARAIRAGTVWVNGYNASFAEMPSGGTKHSGLNRTRGVEGLELFTELKHINWQGLEA